MRHGDHHERLWKRRVRNAPSAEISERQICLYVLWDGDEELPTKTAFDDPILGFLFRARTNWRYWIVVRDGRSIQTEFMGESKVKALVKYKELCREFPRSKDVDYSFPIS